MERIWGKLRKFCYLRSTAILAVFILMVTVLVGGYFLIPKVSAETGDSADNPIILKQGQTIQADAGKWYAIEAKTYNATEDAFTLIHPGTDGKVNLIVGYDAAGDPATQKKGATINLNGDCSAIVLTGTGSETNDFDAQFNIQLRGENAINSTYGYATEPLIDTTSTSYKVNVVDKFSSTSSYFKESSIERNVSVNFTSTPSPYSVLKLTTAANSTGAAIGTPELSKTAKIHLSSGIAGSGGGTVNIDGVTYAHGQQLYLGDFKSYPGSITVTENVSLVINGYGHGAGIGSGASNDEQIDVIHNKAGGKITVATVSAKDVGNTEDVTIKGGTVTIQMAEASKGNCIGSGAIAGNTCKEGKLIVTGGSVKLVPGLGYKYAMVTDAKGAAVYEYTFALGAELAVEDDGKFAISEQNEYVLKADDGGDNDFLIKNNGSLDLTTANAYNTNLSLEVDITPKNSADKFYYFKGYANQQFLSLGDAVGQEKLYFYLPVASLQAHGIAVEDDLSDTFEDISYKYQAQGETSYRDFPADCTLREGKTFSIKFKKSELPSFCTGVSYKIKTEDGVSTAVSLTENDDEEYVLEAMVGSKDMTIMFAFELGTYTVNVDYGTDVLTNETYTETCGNVINVGTPTWEGRTFAGWYYDADFTTPLTDSNDLPTTEITTIIPDEEITLYAKWMCGVYLTDADDSEIEMLQHQIGDELTYDEIKEYNPADTEYNRFIGWETEVDGERVFWEVSDDAEYNPINVQGNITLKACYEKIEYHIYINGLYVDSENPDDKKEILLHPETDFIMSVDKVLEEGENFSSLTFAEVLEGVSENSHTTEDSKVQYNDKISGTITGYQLKAVYAYNSEGQMISELIQKSGDDFSFNMPAMDVYITVEVETIPYFIEYVGTEPGGDVFMDMIPADVEGNPTVFEFNVKSETFKLNPLVSDNKYYEFEGWYLFGDAEKTIITEIATGQFEQDITLVAKWRKVPTYPIIIDEECKEYIKVYDSDGIEIDKGIPGEKLEVVVTPGKGVYYNYIKYIYTVDGVENDHKKTPSEPGKEQTSYFFTMEESESFFTGEFVLIDYTITYVNLLGAKNENPTTYTVKDTIVLNEPEKAGYEFKEWTIVVPDESDGYESVKEVPITEISNRTGNIMLVARWVDEDEHYIKYKVNVDKEAIINGDVEAFEKEAMKADYVFLKITADRGYRLKSVYYMLQKEATPLVLRRSEILKETTDIRYDLTFTAVSDDIYYIVMPDSDINIAAEFEPIVYNITYLNGEPAENPLNYTVESVLTLEDAKEKDGYKFLGWFDAEDNQVTKIENLIGDMVLIAKWEEVKEEIVPPVVEPEPKPEPKPENPTVPEKDYSGVLNQILGTLQQLVNNSASEDTAVQEKPTEEKETPKVEEETQAPPIKPTIIGNAESLLQQIKTGDTANIGQLLVICAVALLAVIVVMPKKKKDDESSTVNEDSDAE